MSNGVFARLISRLRTPNGALGGRPADDTGEPETDRHLFADMLSASVVLDFGGVPADFFQMRNRDVTEDRAPGKADFGKAEPK
jgi:hypothetical protein